MTIEIKLDQEQFDLLLTSLVQIAQSSVRMASAWETSDSPKKEDSPIKEETIDIMDVDPFSIPDKPKKQTWGGIKTRFPDHVSIQAVCNKIGMNMSKKVALAACDILGIKTRVFKDSTAIYIPKDRRDDLENFLITVQKK